MRLLRGRFPSVFASTHRFGAGTRAMAPALCLTRCTFSSYSTAAAAAASVSTTAATAASSSPTTMASSASGGTDYFSLLDRMWNRKWFGTVDDRTSLATATSPEEYHSLFTDLYLACQNSLGLEAWAVILLFGGLTRLITLYFSIYGERASARMQCALPELKAPQEAFNKVYYNDNAAALEVQLAASVLKGERRRVFAEHRTSNLRCLSSIFTAPLLMYCLYQVSALCENPLVGVGTGSFMWCTALVLPDPYCILPATFCALTLMNFELSLRRELKTGWMKSIIWGARLACVCAIPVAASFRSGVCLYFVGMSLVGLLQPILLRVPAFRRMWNFPELPHIEKQVTPVDMQHHRTAGGAPATKNGEAEKDQLQACMTVQFPFLSRLLNPEVEENAQLFTPTTPIKTLRPHPAATTSAAATRFAPGSNPLMREVPLGAGAAASTPIQTGKMDAKRSKSNRGNNFVSGGWKSPQVHFTEEDFLSDDNTEKKNQRK